MLELYHGEPSANSMKPMLLLKEKGIDFVSHYLDLGKFDQHQPDFVKVNPNGQVPVLVHDGTVITESTVINEYLEDVFPRPAFRPRHPAERARMRIWSKFVDEYFCPSLSILGWQAIIPTFVKDLTPAELEAKIAKIPLKEQQDKWRTAAKSFSTEVLTESRRKLHTSIDRMEAALQSARWLAGESYSLADINTYSMVAAMPRLMPDIVNAMDTPRIVAWLDVMSARPAVKAALGMSRRPLAGSVPAPGRAPQG
ncbi:MAG: glutathione S-transferase family protein [Steroidobacteraceae bacterium]